MKIHLFRKTLKLRIVQKGPLKFEDTDSKLRAIDDLVDAKLYKLTYGKGMNTLMKELCSVECEKGSSCVSAKEIWDTLELCHEDSKKLKKVN